MNYFINFVIKQRFHYLIELKLINVPQNQNGYTIINLRSDHKGEF